MSPRPSTPPVPTPDAPPSPLTPDGRAFLARLQRATYRWFVDQAEPRTGLVPDGTWKGAPASVAAVGMALSCHPVGVERGWIARDEAAERCRRVLRFLWTAPQAAHGRASGYKGLFYHFIDLKTGRRAVRSEISTVDSAILFAGALTAAAYFDGPGDVESEVRRTAHDLYQRADWRWATDGEHRISHGWRPGRGFIPYHWGGYNEALLLLVLALGSPDHAPSADAYPRWLETYAWKRIYGYDVLYCGPLATHHLPHTWIDFRGIRDAVMRARDTDYFETGRTMTLVHREYAIRNPRGWKGYGADAWGLSATDGPGFEVREVDGRRRRFWGYRARGVPWGPDDGTLSPSAVAASLPFAPEVVVRALRGMVGGWPELLGDYGLRGGLNPSYPASDDGRGWVSPGYLALEQGPVVLMIENERSGMVWELFGGCGPVRTGLERAGFGGGWLDRA